MLDYFIDWNPLWKIPLLYLSTRWVSASFTPTKQRTPPRGKQPSYETRRAAQEPPNVEFIFPQVLRYYKILSLTLNCIEIFVLFVSASSSMRPFLTSIWLLAEPAAADDMYLSPTFVLGTLLATLGTASRTTAQMAFSTQSSDELVASGPYKLIRHPSYAGTLLVVVGGFLCQIGEGSWWRASDIGDTLLGAVFVLTWLGLVVVVIGGLLYQTGQEDSNVAAAHKEKWVEWAKRTPYRLLPFVY